MILHKLIGLPASGKSTFAKELVAKSGNTVRINRDDLRAMGFESKWTGARERLIVEMERALADRAIRNKYDVIIDDTNLGKDVWVSLAKAWEGHIKVVIHDFTNVPIQTCIDRDLVRDKRVGPGVIYRMAAQAGLIKWDKPIVICDMDGTLADLTHRLPILESKPVDYDKFFERQSYDPPYPEVVAAMQRLAVENDIVIVSGRSDKFSHLTYKWLKDWGVPFKVILMRRGGDHRPDDQIKEELLKLLPKDKIVEIWDDRPRVIAMWRSHGLKVNAVHPENWEGKE